MGGKASKQPGSAEVLSKKSLDGKTKSKRMSNKRKNREDSDSDLDEEDLKLTVELGTKVNDRRISQAKQLIASGRPISITLEATTEEGKDKKKEATWEDDEARLKYKDQLQLMRHFYDWEEIPWDFFVDTYVGGGGEALRKRRLSLSLVAEPAPGEKVHQHTPRQPDLSMPHNRAVAAAAISSQQQNSPMSRQRAASVDVVAVTQHASNDYKLPVAMAQAIPEEQDDESPTNKTVKQPPPLPARKTKATANEASHNASGRRVRAASVAIGEVFPVPAAAAIQKQANPQSPHSAAKPTAVAKATGNKLVASVQIEENRPRRASATSIDQVYGRLGRPGGAYDRFEMENPLNQPAKQQQQQTGRRTVTDSKKPEQFRNMTAVIDPTQFAHERRNTRVSIRKSTVEKPLFDDGRQSTTSTMVDSKSSTSISDYRDDRTTSDWL